MTQALLSTKLFIPELPEQYVSRTKALLKITDGYRKNRQLTLVCAPAGYGKTSVVLEAFRNISCSKAWISLDDGDNDAKRFLSYFAGSLKMAGVDVRDDITCLLAEPALSNQNTILTLLINRIAEWPENLMVALDDYHLIHTEEVYEVMKFLLEHQPANLHLVLITREDPRLPVARLRMKGKLTEIRLEDLLFSKEEAMEFFHKNIGREYSPPMIDQVCSRTEGWVAGLQLAGLLLVDMKEEQAEDFITRFNGASSYIIDYLVEEVLDHVSEELKDFLCKTSVMERMNDKLCEELTGRIDSRELLIQIDKKNLFLIPLDYKKEWYRYHHLFADSLQTNLEEETKLKLYQTASGWMLRNGFHQEAVRYAFKSGNLEFAVMIVGESVQSAFQNGELASLLEWIAQIPEEIVRNNEILCVRKAIALFIVGRAEEGVRHIQSLGQDFMERTSAHNKGLLLSLQAMIANVRGMDAEPLASEALKYLEDWDPISRVSTLNTLGRARYLKGNRSGARDVFEQAFEGGRKLGYQFVTTLALMNYSSCLRIIGQWEIVEELCLRFLGEMNALYDKLPPYAGLIHLVLAALYQDKQDNEKSLFYRETGNAMCRIISFDGEGSLRIYEQRFSGEQEGSDQRSSHDQKSTSVAESPKEPFKLIEKLSEREAEILNLLRKGLSNQEIADTLFITVNTAQWHLSHIYAKLGVKTRAQAMIRAKELE